MQYLCRQCQIININDKGNEKNTHGSAVPPVSLPFGRKCAGRHGLLARLPRGNHGTRRDATMEGGLGKWDSHTNGNGANERTWTINSSMFRMGLTPNAELRLQLDESATHTPEENYGGISNASIGTKIKIFDGSGALPKVAFLGTLLFPGNRHSRYMPRHVGIQTHLLFENEISNLISLGYDIGAEWSGDTDNPDAFFGLCLNFQLSEKLSFFVESYNRYNSWKQDEWAKPGHSSHFNCMSEIGAAYMVSTRLQLNLYGDINFNEPSKYANVGCGLAWLLK